MAVGNESAKCPKCGKAFACCVQQGMNCWCGEMKLSPNHRLYVAANFEGCLCRDCLEQIKSMDSIDITSISGT